MECELVPYIALFGTQLPMLVSWAPRVVPIA